MPHNIPSGVTEVPNWVLVVGGFICSSVLRFVADIVKPLAIKKLQREDANANALNPPVNQAHCIRCKQEMKADLDRRFADAKDRDDRIEDRIDRHIGGGQKPASGTG
jgi:hypothetical protein